MNFFPLHIKKLCPGDYNFILKLNYDLNSEKRIPQQDEESAHIHTAQKAKTPGELKYSDLHLLLSHLVES